LKIAKLSPDKALTKLNELNDQHQKRRGWVWAELGYSPLVQALPLLIRMTEITTKSSPSLSVAEIREYYITEGYLADQCMRKAMACVKAEKDRTAIKSILRLLYAPWLESITKKFQAMIQKDPSVLIHQITETEMNHIFCLSMPFALVIKEFEERLSEGGYKVTLTSNMVINTYGNIYCKTKCFTNNS
jgi:hypothetical protein